MHLREYLRQLLFNHSCRSSLTHPIFYFFPSRRPHYILEYAYSYPLLIHFSVFYCIYIYILGIFSLQDNNPLTGTYSKEGKRDNLLEIA